MATFEYNALTSSGRLMKGTIEAGSRQEANEQLSQMELTVNSIEKARPKRLKTAIGRNEFLLFNQQLESITKSGIPLERGLRELCNDIASKSMRKLIEAIADELEAGVSIEEAFEKRQKHFPPLYGRILKAGVETGRLSEMLASLNRHLDTANRTRRIIFEAICYPAVILSLIAVVITGLFLFVIPQFGIILKEMSSGARLPGLTMFVLSIAENIAGFWTVVGLVIALLIAIFTMLSSSPAGRRFKEGLYFKVPVLGKVYRQSLLSRMAEAMAMMVAAGADMPSCLRLSATAAGSDSLVMESNLLAANIEQGTNILEAGQFCKLIPKLFLYSIQLGSQRNELQDNLYSLGEMYATQTRSGQSRLQAILMPVMILILGLFVLLIILAIFLPIISVVSALGG